MWRAAKARTPDPEGGRDLRGDDHQTMIRTDDHFIRTLPGITSMHACPTLPYIP